MCSVYLAVIHNCFFWSFIPDVDVLINMNSLWEVFVFSILSYSNKFLINKEYEIFPKTLGFSQKKNL